MKKTFWPFGILLIIATGVVLIIATITISVRQGMSFDASYGTDTKLADKNINKIIKIDSLFSQNFKVGIFSTTSASPLVTPANVGTNLRHLVLENETEIYLVAEASGKAMIKSISSKILDFKDKNLVPLEVKRQKFLPNLTLDHKIQPKNLKSNNDLTTYDLQNLPSINALNLEIFSIKIPKNISHGRYSIYVDVEFNLYDKSYLAQLVGRIFIDG